MQSILKKWTDVLLEWLGVSSARSEDWDRWVAFLLVVLLVVLVDYLCRLAFVRTVGSIVRRTRAKWDDELFGTTVLTQACHILSAVVLQIVLPIVFDDMPSVRTVVRRLTAVYLIIAVFRCANALLHAVFRIVVSRPAWQNKPVKGLRQTAQGIVGIICGVLIISVLINKSPAIFLTGLGASAAVLILIFRDSILGFVSGIQLSAFDMLKEGDWIVVPKYEANGIVEEVSLSTVKIRNWDNTLTMLPPYQLISESFQNWHAMQQTGGRRVLYAVCIDLESIRFCTPEMIARFREAEWARAYLDPVIGDAGDSGAEACRKGMPASDNAPRTTAGRRVTNLSLFRAYLLHYLNTEVAVNAEMRMVIRLQQPTNTGLPVQLYFYAREVHWEAYYRIFSDVLDHVIAVVPEFGLRIFQSPSGYDLEQLRERALKGAASASPE